MGVFKRNTLGEKAHMWCFKNKIFVMPRQSAYATASWFIDIERGDYPNRKKMGTSPETYGPTEIWEKVTEYQLYYYNKHKKNEDENKI